MNEKKLIFLDDQLIEIGRNAELTEKGIFNAVNKMSQACFLNLTKRIGENTNNKAVIAQFKRVNNTWKIAVDKLEKEGVRFVKRDGFEIILKEMKDLKPIVKELGL